MADANIVKAIISTRTLLSRFLTSLSNPASNPSPVAPDVSSTQNSSQPPPVLPLLRDSAKLLKAHTTRISLLLLNKPFTPSAIASVLRELHNTCLPALVSSVELCDAEMYGTAMRVEVRARVRRALRETEQLVAEIEDVIKDESQNGQLSKDANREDMKEKQLTSTGLVWSACDAIAELADMGVMELAILKAKEQRVMLEDALAELKEWSEGSTTEENELSDIDDSEDDETNILFGKTPTLPAGPSPLRDCLTKSLKRLQSLIILYRAISKHRLRSFPDVVSSSPSRSKPIEPSSSNTDPPTYNSNNSNNFNNNNNNKSIPKLNSLQTHLSTIPPTTDELAAAFYSLDAPLADVVLSRICASGIQAALTAKLDWSETEDVFSEWVGKWVDMMTTG